MPVTLLSLQEAAQRYRLSSRRLQSLIRDGRIRTIHLDGKELVPDEDIAAVLGQGADRSRWMLLTEAMQRYPENARVLRSLVIRRIITSKRVGRQIVVDRQEIESVVQRLDPRQWLSLRGRRICLSDASRKYGLLPASLSRWARRGHIRVLGREGRKVYLDEADVAYTSALAGIALRRASSLFPKSR